MLYITIFGSHNKCNKKNNKYNIFNKNKQCMNKKKLFEQVFTLCFKKRTVIKVSQLKM